MKKNVFGVYPRDEDRFEGEYIAVIKNKIIAHGKKLKQVIDKAKKITGEPMLVKIPTLGWKESMVLCLNISLKVKK